MTNAWQIWAGTEIMIAIHPMAVWTLWSGAAWCNQCSGTCSAYDWYPVWLRYLAKDIMSEIQDVLTRTESPPSRQLWLWRREKMWRADDRAEASSASGLQRLLRNDRGQWRGHDSASFLSPLFGPVPPPITSFHSLEIIHIHSKAISFYRVKPKKWPFSILLYFFSL